MKINKLLFTYILFIFSSALLGASDYPGDALISSNIVRRLNEGTDTLSFEEKFILVDKALEFNNKNPDAWSYRARLLSQKKEYTDEVLHSFRMLLSCENDIASEYILDYAHFLFRINKNDDLLYLYQNHYDVFLENPEAYFLLKTMGLKTAADLDAYHQNRNSSHPAIQAVQTISDPYIELEDEAWLINAKTGFYHLFALRYVLQNIEMSDDVFLKLYILFKNRYPELEDTYRFADTLYINRFHKLPDHGYGICNQRSYILSVLSTGIPMEELIHSFYTGLLFEDYNMDGIFEEEYYIEKGELKKIIYDMNQDGVIDIKLYFDNGIARIERNNDLILEYYMYPYVRKIVHNDMEYYFNNFSFKRDLLARPLNLDPSLFVRLPWDFSVEKESSDAYYNNAYLVKMGNIQKYLQNGKLTQVVDDINADGIIDIEIDYTNNQPVLGRRDLNFDGFFDIHMIYTEGKLSALKVDEDNTGIPEYIEFLQDQLKAWDLNEDGLLDVEEIELNKNEKIKLASSYMDGIFDYILYETYE